MVRVVLRLALGGIAADEEADAFAQLGAGAVAGHDRRGRLAEGRHHRAAAPGWIFHVAVQVAHADVVVAQREIDRIELAAIAESLSLGRHGRALERSAAVPHRIQ